MNDAIKRFARSLGFEPVGITTADDFPEAEQVIVERIAAGMLGEMRWLSEERARIACRPRARFPWARSLVALGMPYYPLASNSYARRERAGGGAEGATSPPRGQISRYALGDDYHAIIGALLERLAAFVEGLGDGARAHGCVDTGPVAERAVAVRAGIGWFGKNTNLLTPRHGSWVFLAVLFTSLDLTPDVPLGKSCGSCRRCLDACPTGALVAPYTLDAGRCLSYLTIELRGSIPRQWRPRLGELIFGCDICQEVCPVNAKAQTVVAPVLPARPYPGQAPELMPLLALDEVAFGQRFRRSALRRAKRAGLQRNVAVALGNSRDPAALPALRAALGHDSPLVRAHAAWALGRIGGREAWKALGSARQREEEQAVIEEIDLALAAVH